MGFDVVISNTDTLMHIFNTSSKRTRFSSWFSRL